MTFKEFRLSQGLSQPKLAKALGIGVSTVGNYEAGRIKPSGKVITKIKEVFGVDLANPVPAEPVAAPAPAVEEKAAKKPRTRKKKEAVAEAAPTPVVEEKAEAPAKPKRTRKKKETAPTVVEAAIEAAVEATPAPVVEEKVEKPAKRSRKKKEAPVEAAPAKKPRTRKKKEEPATAPVDSSLLQMQSDAEAAVHALFNEKGTVIIQSPMGGEITPEEVLAKVGPVDKVYVRVDLNTAYWVRGDESGAVNLW